MTITPEQRCASLLTNLGRFACSGETITDRAYIAPYAEAVSGFLATSPLLDQWPECRAALLEDGPGKSADWTLALPSVCCLAVGGVPTDAVPVGAAWAALHRAALVLDAVQDAPETLTPATYINLATGLVFAAFRFLGNVESHETYRRVTALFAEAAFQSSLGQHLSLTQNYEGLAATQAVTAYWRAAIARSGSIFRAATAGGAAVGSDSESQIAALGEYGVCLGVILQVLDDCRDVLTGSESTTCEISLPLLLLSMSAQSGCPGDWRVGMPDPEASTPRESLLSTLSEDGIPEIVASVLDEWKRRALESLTSLERSDATMALESIVEYVLSGPV